MERIRVKAMIMMKVTRLESGKRLKCRMVMDQILGKELLCLIHFQVPEDLEVLEACHLQCNKCPARHRLLEHHSAPSLKKMMLKSVMAGNT